MVVAAEFLFLLAREVSAHSNQIHSSPLKLLSRFIVFDFMICAVWPPDWQFMGNFLFFEIILIFASSINIDPF